MSGDRGTNLIKAKKRGIVATLGEIGRKRSGTINWVARCSFGEGIFESFMLGGRHGEDGGGGGLAE